MKTSISLAAALTLFASRAHRARAHYTFPYIVDASGTESAAWQYIRETQNYETQNPLTDVTDPLFRCYENNTAAQTSTITLAAGGTYSFIADNTIYHPGYLDVYMGSVSDATSESAGDGSVWFKIFEDAPVYDADVEGFYIFPSQTTSNVTFKIPSATPSAGSYLIRVEQIALHVASVYGGAQFYIACAEVEVTGGGSGSPGPLVAIPGVYTGYEPGILISQSPSQLVYIAQGFTATFIFQTSTKLIPMEPIFLVRLLCHPGFGSSRTDFGILY
ncbi:hypothetical protein DL93DRAFT_2062409 [Clavulina sp. PMI_390]|nr:hypothetical protein DL93DRAFT_2062409 [Clavulina sp. PMI_390]